MSAPVLSWPFNVQRSRSYQGLQVLRMAPTFHRCVQQAALARLLDRGVLHPALRANPSPEVTDLFCRLPLSTLIYTPEAVNLGDLMRLSVRTGVRITKSLRFSSKFRNAPDTSENEVLYHPFSPCFTQRDSRAAGC